MIESECGKRNDDALLRYFLPFLDYLDVESFNLKEMNQVLPVNVREFSLEEKLSLQDEIRLSIRAKAKKPSSAEVKSKEHSTRKSDSITNLEDKIKDGDNKLEIISIDYHESEREAVLKFTDKGKKEYSIYVEKKTNEKAYELNIRYDYAKESFSVDYSGPLRDYLTIHRNQVNDFASKVLFNKQLNIIPASFMGGVLGYTYLGENFAARRDDLTGKTAFMVDVHEAIHTPDEYETRVLTTWILSKEMSKYLK